MRIFAGEWVKKVLSMLGMKEGERIESKMVTRRIEGAQKKREEYNFEVRKNLLEYDEVMDEQRKRVYGYRQKILNGVNCRDLILEMITEQIDHHIEMFLARDFGVETFASWAQTRLAMGQDSPLDPRHFRGLSLKDAEEIAKDEAVRACESDIFQSVEENLPDDEDADKGDWNWASLAKFANSRWGLNLRDRDLKKEGRDGISELLIEKASEAINAIDLSEGESFLEDDFSIKSALDWAYHRFGLELKKEDICKHLGVANVHDIEPAPLKQFITEHAEKIYDDKEAEYPVLAGLYRYSTSISGGQSRIDREGLVSWAKDRFEVDLELEDLKNKQREDIRAVLIDHSRKHQEKSKQTLAVGNEKLQSLLQGGQIPQAEGNGELASMSDWLRETLKCELTTEEMAEIDAEQLQQRLVSAVGDRFHPEMRRMERQLVLDIVDSSWKDHLLAMDYLRAAVRLKGWAQLDPKVEYKRLGMKQYDEMWTSIGDQVTDLIFRMEQMPEDYVSNTFVETEARHDEAQTEIARQQQEAIDGSQGDGKIEPIRNRGEQVGRNDPCPCKSGKKYKKCCMRKETVT
ncbi:MAG: SEC-C domain-containing protein [Planctomycetes bacterium]|nr:SEC-C domain-containing protein [Planctomycetota bacterium]